MDSLGQLGLTHGLFQEVHPQAQWMQEAVMGKGEL